ncbi:unnamed protein product [Didymodactylos carnosus]|uniref:Uncharacterized protein n=1 Tax=Didymodactylos carnosus TaxID=1234261 RepID=A0A814N958_9BILA|nr:unnamed protein product [Didymodactylos carnosus]CAF1088523.1 unnamed protein product [Didymodactylos carnosus]CAF3754308.1 unnamed protein product [Didymodactylos carnosus]CAF3853981.1 unnamed protein product [Didymodactylos carnosus]
MYVAATYCATKHKETMNQANVTIEKPVFNRQQSVYDGMTNNTEAIIAVWLDTSADKYESTQDKIRNTADILKIFSEPDQCEKYIRSIGNAKFFLAISIEYAQTLVEKLHALRQLHSVYVYSDETSSATSNNEWLDEYPKVINVYDHLDLLAEELSTTIYKYSRNASVPITIFKHPEADRTTNLLNKFAYFVDFWNPLFIDLILDLPLSDYDYQKKRFIQECKTCYRADLTNLKIVEKFENTYKPSEAIQWYKRDSFVYRLLNKVLRQQNIEGILTFRFFILDMFEQLKTIYKGYINDDTYEDNSYIIVYRGQLMSEEELEILKKDLAPGTVVSVNSFLSASRTRKVALIFSGASGLPNAHLNSVVFEIKINIHHKNLLKRKPFADVSQLSKQDEDECEVIFMVGSFFRIDNIVYDGIEKVTIVKSVLIDEDDHTMSITKDYQILKRTITVEGKLIRIGNLLMDHPSYSQSSKAKGYYKVLENELKLSKSIFPACLVGQGWVDFKNGNYDSAIKLQVEALAIYNKLDDKNNNESAISSLNCIGAAYMKLNDYPKALDYYNRAYNLSNPIDDRDAERVTYQGPCIPIDKFAMYDGYRNISSIKMACIQKMNGNCQQAWDIYKNAIDYEMRDTINFHSHTCMTIAEAGVLEAKTPEDQNKVWKNWKSFLNIGLGDVLKYRSSAITGYLSLGHQYTITTRLYNNVCCRDMAIDYFRKVEKECLNYASNRDHYLYTLQCYERLAVLYQDKSDFKRSIDYYEKIIGLCLKYSSNDLENIIVGYKGMIETYEKQLIATSSEDSDISLVLCDAVRPPVSLETSMSSDTPSNGTLFKNVKRFHFAFGQYDKRVDLLLNSEPDLHKKRVYCYMKLAALYYDQEKIVDAQHSLSQAILLCKQIGSELFDVLVICNENIAFIHGNFDLIIQSYRNLLENRLKGDSSACIGEDNYCYIAQLYEKKNDFNSAFEYYQKPVEYFEQHGHLCSHTIYCFMKLAKHYQTTKNDFDSAVDVLEKGITLVLKHRREPMITAISIIRQHLVEHFKVKNDLNTAILIYESVCELVKYERTDIIILYRDFKKVLKLLVKQRHADVCDVVLDAYEAFLDLILKTIGPLTPHIKTILAHYKNFAVIYKKLIDSPSAIEIYQKLICLTLKHPNDTVKIVWEYKVIAAEFGTRGHLDASVNAYEKLLEFACQHHSTNGFSEGDLIDFVLVAWKEKIISRHLTEKNFDSAIILHYKIIHFLEKYRSNVNTDYVLDEFIARIMESYSEIARIYHEKNDIDRAIDTYGETIEFLTIYETQTVQEHITLIISKCHAFAAKHRERREFDFVISLYSKLIMFIQKYRLNYLFHLAAAYNRLAELLENVAYKHSAELILATNCCYLPNAQRSAVLNKCVLDYIQKAEYYLSNNQLDLAIKTYRTELLAFLLENHSLEDERISSCYRNMASVHYEQNENVQTLQFYLKAVDIYESQKESFYTDIAFELNPNVCRRYAGTLFTCYNNMATVYQAIHDVISAEICRQKIIDIYEKHNDQFQLIRNPAINIITVQICPMVELNY